MVKPVSLNSRIWPAKGVKPAVGDETYQAGEQPIAPYDNWAMWAITRDIYNVTDELGNHNDHHEVGGRDEIDLQNLQVNGVAALNGDPSTDELRLVDPSDSTSFARFDVNNDLIRQFPAFGIAPTLQQGAAVGADLTNPDSGTALYDVSAGTDGKFHHAKEADHAADADYATTAGSLEGDNGTYLTASQDATITGTWTFDNVISGSIDGNAATADTATTADSATSADHATTAGDADTVDNYHAQEIIDAASASAEWAKIADTTHSTVGNRWTWQHTSSTVYDRYRLVIYHESHKSSGPKSYFWLQLGSGGIDTRYRYRWRERRVSSNEWTGHKTSDGFTVAGATPQKMSTTELVIDCPRAVNSPSNHYPVVGDMTSAAPYDVPKLFHYGALQTNYPTIDTFRLRSDGTVSTGNIILYGKNLGAT